LRGVNTIHEQTQAQNQKTSGQGKATTA
jgi:hypothetical protein